MIASFRAFLRRSIDGVRVDSERLREIEPDQIHFKDVVAFFIRAWPYVRPVRWHAFVYIAMAMFVLVWGTVFALINFGMIYNSVILDLPLSAAGAALFSLDPAQWVEVEHLTKAQRYALIPRLLILGVISTSVGTLIDHGNRYYRVWILQEINQNLRLHLLRQLQSLSLKFHAEARTGDAMYRLFQDSAMVTQILQALIVDPLLAILRFLLGIFVVAAFSPPLALFLLLAWVPMLWLTRRMSTPLRRGFQEARAGNAALTSSIQESMEGIRTIKVHGLEGQRQKLFEHHSTRAFEKTHDARVRLLLFGFLVFVCSALPLVFIELRAALYAHQGVDTFFRDFLLVFGFAVWNLGGQDQVRGMAKLSSGSSEGMINLWGRAQDMAIGLNRVYQVLDLTPDVENWPDAIPLARVEKSIEFSHVAFSYPEREVFRDVSFVARVGEITALLGATGTGKTTLTLLLLRMFEYQAGRIALDGREIRDFTMQSVRDKITLATQENILFSTTVLENIRYARPDASDEEVREAARVACADEFIERLSSGYATFLGERATKLSSGQRQRLVIARAILKDTPILILDEPTASLDAATERRIMTNIKVWAAQRTVFLVTHRLSTARQADCVVFLDDGCVAAAGHHEELMERPGPYRRFVLAETDGQEAESS